MRIAIIGAGGRLGAALLRAYRNKFDVNGFDRAQLDITNFDEVRAKLGARDFDLLINAAAFTRVDLCETQPEEAFRVNAEAPGVLAEICSEKGARLIHFSTDYVFDGEKRQPYTEEDEARPISVYGASKLAGERNVLKGDSCHLVVRVSWVFGPDRPSFIDAMIQRGCCPIFLPDRTTALFISAIPANAAGSSTRNGRSTVAGTWGCP
jgi:dTDP-4-dehydrorhamnose reductase